MKTLLLALLLAGLAAADGAGVIVSSFTPHGSAPAARPDTPFWRGVKGVFAQNGPMGGAVPGHRTEIRSRWTDENLYFLFICPYETLYLKPGQPASGETNKLWEWDVAEVFIGSDFDNIRRYKEFQVSPRGEWVDLDIDRDNPKPDAWRWNAAGYRVAARIDSANKVWYGEMSIPWKAIDSRPPAPGNELRVNLYRIQGGPDPNRKFVAWQPTGASTYHVPEAFGRLRLER